MAINWEHEVPEFPRCYEFPASSWNYIPTPKKKSDKKEKL